jgi:hypothetical protein
MILQNTSNQEVKQKKNFKISMIDLQDFWKNFIKNKRNN